MNLLIFYPIQEFYQIKYILHCSLIYCVMYKDVVIENGQKIELNFEFGLLKAMMKTTGQKERYLQL